MTVTSGSALPVLLALVAYFILGAGMSIGLGIRGEPLPFGGAIVALLGWVLWFVAFHLSVALQSRVVTGLVVLFLCLPTAMALLALVVDIREGIHNSFHLYFSVEVAAVIVATILEKPKTKAHTM